LGQWFEYSKGSAIADSGAAEGEALHDISQQVVFKVS
jgi:hypothetical protein